MRVALNTTTFRAHESKQILNIQNTGLKHLMDQTVSKQQNSSGHADIVSYKHWFKGLLVKLQLALVIDLRRRGGVLIAIDNVFKK